MRRQRRKKNHTTICECDDSDSKIKLVETLETLEDSGQTIVDALKQMNLGTNEEPLPIYLSSLLMPKIEKEYFDLLSEYMDMFARSYKELPKLAPKFAVHRPFVKKAISFKKQP